MKTKFNFLSSVLFLAMVLLGGISAFAADITVTGTVSDQANDEPLIGVSVTMKGRSGFGTTTDANGNFTVKVPEGSTLVFFVCRLFSERAQSLS